MHKIFVYGSLRKGMYNYDLYLKGKSNFVSNAYVKGTLYSLKDKKYPALIAGENYILGEIYEVDIDTLLKLDELESYVEGSKDNEYNKVNVPIYNENNKQIESLDVYFYNDANSLRNTLLESVIECNDYCKHYIEKYV